MKYYSRVPEETESLLDCFDNIHIRYYVYGKSRQIRIIVNKIILGKCPSSFA